MAEAKEAGAPPHWLTYISTDDVDATAAKASELGGRVMHPATDIPGAGRFAVLADPQGAVFAIYASAAESAGDEECAPQVGEFSWHELATTDHAAALDFYAELFGWERAESMDMGEAGIYQMYRRPGGCAPDGAIKTL